MVVVGFKAFLIKVLNRFDGNQAKKRGDYPHLLRRVNGFFYIIYDRSNKKSLKTKDERTASRLFREEVKALGVREGERQRRIKRVRLSEFSEQYLEARQRKLLQGEIAESTFKNDRRALGKFLEAVGNMPLRKVSTRTIDAFKDALRADGRGEGNINALLRHLSSSFSAACEEDFIDFNPFSTSTVTGSVFFDDKIRAGGLMTAAAQVQWRT